MKIAFFSDVHGNLPALRAILQDIDERSPDSIYCLGDLVNFAPWPDEVINLIRERKIQVICGNHDEGIGNNNPHYKFSFRSEAEKTAASHAIAFTNETIQADNRQYLKTLPKHIRIEFDFLFRKINLLMVHGSPLDINEYVYETIEDNDFREMMNEAGCNILLMGHTHRPFHKIIFEEENNQKMYLHAINVGSAGMPKDDDWRACYCILELTESSSLFDPSSIKVYFVRISYDVEETISAILTSPIPNLYAELLPKA